jgi:IPT/TIG domain
MFGSMGYRGLTLPKKPHVAVARKMKVLTFASVLLVSLCGLLVAAQETCISTIQDNLDSVHGVALDSTSVSALYYVRETQNVIGKLDLTTMTATTQQGGYLNQPRAVTTGNFVWVASYGNCLVLQYAFDLSTVLPFGTGNDCRSVDGPRESPTAFGTTMLFNRPSFVCSANGGDAAFVIEAGGKLRRIGNNILSPSSWTSATLGPTLATACVYDDKTKNLYYSVTSSSTTNPVLMRLTMSSLLPNQIASGPTTVGTISVAGIDPVLNSPFIQYLAEDYANTDLVGVFSFGGGNKQNVIVTIKKGSGQAMVIAGRVPTTTARYDDYYSALWTDLRTVKGAVRNKYGEVIFSELTSMGGSLRMTGTGYCSKLTCEDCTPKNVITPYSGGGVVKAVRNITMLVTPSAWAVPTGQSITIPCFSQSGSPYTMTQQMLMAGYRFGVSFQKAVSLSGGFSMTRSGFIPCRAVSVYTDGGGITPFPACQKRARVNCTLATDLDAADWTPIAFIVGPTTSLVSLSGFPSKVDASPLDDLLASINLASISQKASIIVPMDSGTRPGIGAGLPALQIASASITGYTALNDGKGSSLANLLILGNGFGPSLAATVEQPYIFLGQTIGSATLCSVTSVAATFLTARCPVTAVVWRANTRIDSYFQWLHYGIIFSVDVTPMPPIQFANFVPSKTGQPRWGERIAFAGSSINVGLSKIEFVPSSAAIAAAGSACTFCSYVVPCVNQESLGDHAVACTLRIAHEALLGSSNTGLQVKLSYAAIPNLVGGGAVTRTIPSSSITSLNVTNVPFRILWQAPSAIQLPSATLDRAGGQSVTIQLPYSRMALSDFVGMGLAPAILSSTILDSVTGTIGGVPCPRCGFADLTTVVCTTPASYLPQAKLVITMVGSLNLTHDGLSPTSSLITSSSSSAQVLEMSPSRAPYLVYDPPLLNTIYPQTVLLPPFNDTGLATNFKPSFMSPANVSFAIDSPELWLAVKRGDITTLLIGQARPASITAATTDTRSVYAIDVPRKSLYSFPKTGAIAMTTKSDPFATLKVNFTWAGLSVTPTNPTVKGVLRPSVYSLAPQRVSGGKLVTIFGTDICPAGACDVTKASLEVSVVIGNQLCSGLTASASTVITCTAPNLDQATTPGFPFPLISIINSVGSASVDQVPALYPAPLAAAWLLDTRALIDGAISPVAAVAPPNFAGEQNPLPLLPTPILQVFGNGTASCTIRAIPPASSSSSSSSSSTSATQCDTLSANTLLDSFAAGDITAAGLYGLAVKPYTASSSSQQGTTRAIAATGADLGQSVTILATSDGSATVPIKKIGLAAAMGCTVELRATCTDALLERTEQTGPLLVQTPRLLGNWTGSTYSTLGAAQTIGVPPSADFILSSATASLAWSSSWPPVAGFANGSVDDVSTRAAAALASSHLATAVDSSLLCNARLAPSSFAMSFATSFGLTGVPASQSLSVANGIIIPASSLSSGGSLPVGQFSAASVASSSSFTLLPLAAQASFPSLSLLRAPLGADLSIFAECSWLSSGEKLILPPLPLRVLSANVLLTGFPSNTSAQVSVLPYQSFAVPVKIAVVGLPEGAPTTLFADAGGICMWRPPTSTSGGPALQLSGATAGATYSVRPDGSLSSVPSITVEGSFSDAAIDVVLVCSLWQRTVESRPLRISASSLKLSFVDADGNALAEDTNNSGNVPSFLPRYFLPSDRSSESPLLPLVNVSLFDGAGVRVSGVKCELSASPSDVAVRATASGSRFSVQASDLASSDGIVRFGRIVLVTGFSTPVVRLTVSCSRQAAQDQVQMSWEVRALPLAASICSPPVSIADSQAPLPQWNISVGVLPLDTVVISNTSSSSEAMSVTVDANGNMQQKALWPVLPSSLGHQASTAYTPWLCDPARPLEDRIPPDVAVLLQRGDIRCTVESDMTWMSSSSSSSSWSDGKAKWYLGEAASTADANGIADFSSMSLAGQQNTTFWLQATCRIGGVIDVPSALPFKLTIRGCPAGSIPDGFLCRTCDANRFSFGGSDKECKVCPKRGGAVCSEGKISLLSDWWRAPSETGQPIGPDSALFPCPIPGACLLDASNAAMPKFTCARGYAGPTCGHCDAPRYAFFGEACGPCWAPEASMILLAFIVIFIVSLIVLTAWQSGNDAAANKDTGILLRILLTYLQALGSLKAFRLGGGTALRNYFGWTSAVTVSPFSLGPVQCALQFGFLQRFVSIALLPLLAAAAVMLAYLLISFVRALCAKRATPASSPSTAAVNNTPSKQGLMNAWSLDLITWWGHRKPFAIVLSLSSLAFMPIVGACIAALDCMSEQIDGVSYLRSDLSVACYQGSHAIARILAIVLLVVIGVGFPFVVIAALWKANEASTRSPAFRSVWLPLYHGYKTSLSSESSALATTPPVSAGAPSRAVGKAGILTAVRRRTQVFLQMAAGATTAAGKMDTNGVRKPAWCVRLQPASLMFWEGVVLTRKLCIVLLATLVVDGYLQTVGFQLLLLLAFMLHIYSRPFVRGLFNVLEGLALLATLLTAILASLLLETSSDLSTGGSTTGMTGISNSGGQSGEDLQRRSEAVAIFLIVMNGVLLAVIGLFYLRALVMALCTSKAATQMASRSKIVAKITTNSQKMLSPKQPPAILSPRGLPALPSDSSTDGDKNGVLGSVSPLYYRQNDQSSKQQGSSRRSAVRNYLGIPAETKEPNDDKWGANEAAGINDDDDDDGRLEPVINPLALGGSESGGSAGSTRMLPTSRKSFTAMRVGTTGVRSHKMNAVINSMRPASATNTVNPTTSTPGDALADNATDP